MGRCAVSQYRKYLFSYRFEGAEYGFDIPATSPDEAKRRLSAMGMARYDGELYATIPVPSGGLLLRLWGWLSRSGGAK